MDKPIEAPSVDISLMQIVKREVDLYAAESDVGTFHAVLDDINQTYAVIVVDNDRSASQIPVWVVVMARVTGDKVVIEEDVTPDKHLYLALMKNGDIPREKIILAYKGEKLLD